MLFVQCIEMIMKKWCLQFLIVHVLCGWEWMFFFLCLFSKFFNMFYLLHNEIKKKGCISISFFDFPLGTGDYWNIPVKGPDPHHPQFLSSKFE